MASSTRGLRLLKTLDLVKTKSSFDAATVLSKTKFISAENGVLKGSLTIEPIMCNIEGSLHGGYISNVIDVFSFYSQLSHPKGRLSWTTTMNVVYLRSALVGETINVETKSLRNGNLCINETLIHNESGNLLAKGTTTHLAGNEEFQTAFKDKWNFDVYEK